jgi:hypothetical protein
MVVDDEKSSRDRIALAHEDVETYDASYYETQIVRAVEMYCHRCWDRTKIWRGLAETREVELTDQVGAVSRFTRAGRFYFYPDFYRGRDLSESGENRGNAVLPGTAVLTKELSRSQPRGSAHHNSWAPLRDSGERRSN